MHNTLLRHSKNLRIQIYITNTVALNVLHVPVSLSSTTLHHVNYILSNIYYGEIYMNLYTIICNAKTHHTCIYIIHLASM